MEKKTRQIGFYDRGTGQHQSNTVYKGGVCPTITTIGVGGTQQIKVIKKRECDKENNRNMNIGIKQAVTKGYIECNVPGCADLSYPTSRLRRGRVQGGGYDKPHNYNDFRSLQDYGY